MSRLRLRVAWHRPRAKKFCAARRRSISCSGRKAIIACPSCSTRARRDGKAVDTEFPVEDKFDFLPAPTRAVTRTRGVTAFITVQEGCDKFCTFCVVPYTRGAEVSRPVAKIVTEAERLADAGVREITVIGQNVNAFHGEGPDGKPWSLARLLQRLAEIPGIARLRYTTSHPRDVDDDLIAAHRDMPSLMPQLHLPVQSGSDRMLAAMNRRHTRADYLRVIEKLRAAQPAIALTSDFIVGFPGESDRDFDDTLRLIEEVGFLGRVLLQVFPAPRHTRRRNAGTGRAGAAIPAIAGIAGADRRATGRLQRRLRRAKPRRAVRKSRAASRTDCRPLALSAAGPCHGFRRADRRGWHRDDHRH